MTCIFFGHSNTALEIRDKLKATLIDLIENRSVDLFYVGDKGNFDRLALSVLREIGAVYPIRYYVVLAYLPKEKTDYPTLFPEGIETVRSVLRSISVTSLWLSNQTLWSRILHTRSVALPNLWKWLAKRKRRS